MIRKGQGGYQGQRDSNGDCKVYGSEGVLQPRLDIRNHSPAGFNWGYGGSGPAQLSLAILADAVGDELAELLYQQFKEDFTSRWKGNEWSLSLYAVQQWVLEKVTDGKSNVVARLHEEREARKEAVIDEREFGAGTVVGGGGDGEVVPEKNAGTGESAGEDAGQHPHAIEVVEAQPIVGGGEVAEPDARPSRNRKTRG